MNLIIKLNEYEDKNIFFSEPIKNTIINEGKFIRIIYSTQQFILNGIYLLIYIKNVSYEKYYNKYKYNFNIISNTEIINNIFNIENTLLKKINIQNKTPVFKISEQLKNGNLKIFTNNDEINDDVNDTYFYEKINEKNNMFLLRISGIWETDLYYGITYKFTKINHLYRNILA
jgi:hypothetical protein